MTFLPSLKIAYITGTDRNRLLNAGILHASFHHHMPEQTLHVCDFGMAPNERVFWQKAGGYLPRPARFSARLHPWYYKAGLCEFVDTSQYDAVIWLDADMLVLAPLHNQIEDIVRTMKAQMCSVGVTPDSARLSVGDTLQAFAKSGRDTAPFEQLMKSHNKSPTDTYLNTGFLVCVDFDFCKRWHLETLRQEEWLLFEQNTFNALVGAQGGQVLELDNRVWNVHGDLLANVDISDPSGSARLLHTTSAGQRHHIENEIRYPIGDRVLPGWFKLFERKDLRDLQQHYLLLFLQDHLGALSQSGLLVGADHA